MNMKKNINAVIADNLLDNYLAFDQKSKTSFDILASKNQVVVMGKVMSTVFVPVIKVVRDALQQIGYTENADSIAILHNIQGLAFEVNRGVERIDPLCKGTDSSVVVLGYATNETENFMPTEINLTQPLTRLQQIAYMHINYMNAFCGCDPSKIKRSASYAARHIAKNLVAAGISDEIIVQVAYVEEIAKPVSLFVDTCNKGKVEISDNEISRIVADKIFDMRPEAIVQRLKLHNPIYTETALKGHFGQMSQKIIKTFSPWENPKEIEVELFTWEKLDYVDIIKKGFDLK